MAIVLQVNSKWKRTEVYEAITSKINKKKPTNFKVAFL